jgi:hypothetical protein
VVPPIFLIQVLAGLVVSDAAWELVSKALSGFGTSSLRSVAQAAISVLKARSSLRRVFETWFSIVRSERCCSEANWQLECLELP